MESEMVDEQVEPLLSSVETESNVIDEQVQPLLSSVDQTERSEMVDEQNPLITSFLAIAVGQSVETAKQYLQASNWNVETAVGLFYNEDVPNPHRERAVMERPNARASELASPYHLPHRRERIVRDEMEHSNVRPVDNSELASLYRPPLELMHKGSFYEVKDFAEKQNKWLIINVQSKREFSSNTLNLDTWAHEAVSQTIAANFIFWQVYDDVTEGQKVCNFYKLTSFPAVLVLDPTTGQKMKLWSGMIDATRLLEDLDPFMDAGPERRTETSRTTIPETTKKGEEVFASPALKENMPAAVTPSCSDTDELISDEPSTSPSQKLTYPDLPEEPKVDKTLLCRIGVRLPDGRRLQRNFLKTDLIQLLWSFCSFQLNDAESRPFQLTQAIPGALKALDYAVKQTFEESGLSNSMISVTWD